MKRVTSIATACVAAVILVLGASVGAQDFNIHEKTFLTFSNSVEMPGMTLPAGTYTFKLADTPSRNVVQVLSQDEKQIHGQFLFIQAERPEVTGETVIAFRETREGTTPAIQYLVLSGREDWQGVHLSEGPGGVDFGAHRRDRDDRRWSDQRELHRELGRRTGTGDGVEARADHDATVGRAGGGDVGHLAGR